MSKEKNIFVIFIDLERQSLFPTYWRWEKPQEGGGWIVFLETSSFTF